MRHPRGRLNVSRLPGRQLGKPPRGTKTAGSVRLAVNAKAVMPRGASRDAGARVMCARDPSGEIRTTRLLGAPHPSCEGKERETGRPRARPKVRDRHSVGFLAIECGSWLVDMWKIGENLCPTFHQKWIRPKMRLAKNELNFLPRTNQEHYNWSRFASDCNALPANIHR